MRFLAGRFGGYALSLYAIGLGFLAGIIEPAPPGGHWFALPKELTWEIAAPGIVLATFALFYSLFFTKVFLGEIEGGVIISSSGSGVYLPWKKRRN